MYEWSTIVFPVGISDGMIGISELENQNGAQKFQKLYSSLRFTTVYFSEMRLKLWINSEQVLSMGLKIKKYTTDTLTPQSGLIIFGKIRI